MILSFFFFHVLDGTELLLSSWKIFQANMRCHDDRIPWQRLNGENMQFGIEAGFNQIPIFPHLGPEWPQGADPRFGHGGGSEKAGGGRTSSLENFSKKTHVSNLEGGVGLGGAVSPGSVAEFSCCLGAYPQCPSGVGLLGRQPIGLAHNNKE